MTASLNSEGLDEEDLFADCDSEMEDDEAQIDKEWLYQWTFFEHLFQTLVSCFSSWFSPAYLPSVQLRLIN